MKLSKMLSGLTGCMLAAASLSGCIIVDNDDDYPSSGSLTVEMTVDGSDHSFQCFDYDVDGLAVMIEDGAGYVTEAIVDCDDFGLTIDNLPAGYYDVSAWLTDFDGFSKSDIVVVPDVEVFDGLDTVVDVDFDSSWIDP
ncbi:hypothetical protein SOCE26_004790 [Sorangium cellulosum]|uniref:Secreted protein n=1 Tax=Sorangium cellulosum TaxID=56 RepID=A0A2L0EIJ4_SORCE|nr:hypothetical protein [Sorangium cellulosum]AUX39097.1 hypothetical protein SOCE26_004790 [Sorangium cellulosum]